MSPQTPRGELTIGFLPLVDACLPILAHEHGFAEAEGLSLRLVKDMSADWEPEKYRDLIVRVAGYSAYFVELCKEVQDEIISRTVIEKF